MKLLLLGCSNIVRRRVLPALAALGHDSVDIASASATVVQISTPTPFRLFHDYATALRQSDADVVYVSLINSLHARWASEALEAGFHVIVDKPACLALDDVGRLVDIAARKELCLAEALVYFDHPQIAMALRLFEEAGSTPTRIVTTFSFPPLPPEDYRYRRDAGGGALWDLGPYAVSAGRIVFGAKAERIVGHLHASRGEVDTGFGMLATYPGGRDCVGAFGYTTGYVNRIEIMGADLVVSVDRAFSPPRDAGTELIVRHRDQLRRIAVPAADAFELFLRRYFEALATGDRDAFVTPMLADAEAIDRLRASAMG